MAMEIELKVLFEKKELDLFLKSVFYLEHKVVGSDDTLDLITTYYDKQDWSLKKEGTIYRIRQTMFSDGHSEYEATIKRTISRNGGMTAREEINTPQSNAKPKLPGVSVMFMTSVRRHISLLKFGNAIIEMAVDKGYLKTVTDKCEIIDEVEFEIKEGTEEDLKNFKAELIKNTKFAEEERSKYARGLALLGQNND